MPTRSRFVLPAAQNRYNAIAKALSVVAPSPTPVLRPTQCTPVTNAAQEAAPPTVTANIAAVQANLATLNLSGTTIKVYRIPAPEELMLFVSNTYYVLTRAEDVGIFGQP